MNPRKRSFIWPFVYLASKCVFMFLNCFSLSLNHSKSTHFILHGTTLTITIIVIIIVVVVVISSSSSSENFRITKRISQQLRRQLTIENNLNQFQLHLIIWRDISTGFKTSENFREKSLHLREEKHWKLNQNLQIGHITKHSHQIQNGMTEIKPEFWTVTDHRNMRDSLITYPYSIQGGKLAEW